MPTATESLIGKVAQELSRAPSYSQRGVKESILVAAATSYGSKSPDDLTQPTGFDPEAAHVVFAGWHGFELVDWEACVRHAMSFARFDGLLAQGDGRARFHAAISRQVAATLARFTPNGKPLQLTPLLDFPDRAKPKATNIEVWIELD